MKTIALFCTLLIGITTFADIRWPRKYATYTGQKAEHIIERLKASGKTVEPAADCPTQGSIEGFAQQHWYSWKKDRAICRVNTTDTSQEYCIFTIDDSGTRASDAAIAESLAWANEELATKSTCVSLSDLRHADAATPSN